MLTSCLRFLGAPKAQRRRSVSSDVSCVELGVPTTSTGNVQHPVLQAASHASGIGDIRVIDATSSLRQQQQPHDAPSTSHSCPIEQPVAAGPVGFERERLVLSEVESLISLFGFQPSKDGELRLVTLFQNVPAAEYSCSVAFAEGESVLANIFALDPEMLVSTY
jgi:hypothetical protein